MCAYLQPAVGITHTHISTAGTRCTCQPCILDGIKFALVLDPSHPHHLIVKAAAIADRLHASAIPMDGKSYSHRGLAQCKHLICTLNASDCAAIVHVCTCPAVCRVHAHLQLVVGLADPCAVERVGLDDVCTRLQVCCVDLLDD